MSDDALFDVFDQEEPAPIVDLPPQPTTKTNNEKRSWTTAEDDVTLEPSDETTKRSKAEFLTEPSSAKYHRRENPHSIEFFLLRSVFSTMFLE